MTTITAKLTFDDTLGAEFLGGIIASVLYGVTCVQTFIFLKGSQADRTYLKIIVISLWTIDTVQHILVIHSLYYYMVTNYGNPLAVQNFIWSLAAQLIPGATSDALVRSVYVLRIWRLTHRREYIVVIGALCLYHLGSSLALALDLLDGHLEFPEVNRLSWVLYSALPCAVVVDALIAIVLCCTIYQKRTGFKNTNAMLKTLIALAVNTGVLMTFGSIAVFVAYVARPHNLIYIGTYMPTNKIYINSLLASLNARDYVRGNNNIVMDSEMPTFNNEGSMDLPALSPSYKSSNAKNFKSSSVPQANFSSSTIYANDAMPTKIDVKVDKEASTM